MLRSGKLRRRAAQDEAQRIISNYVRDLAVAPKFCLCCSFKVCCASKKDRHGAAFLQQLVNMTLYPAEQKKASGPVPRLPGTSIVLSAQRGSRQGARLVKSMWNTDSYFKRAGADSCSHHPQVRTVKSCRLFEASSVFKIFIVLKYGDRGWRLFICVPGLQPWAQQTYECHTTIVFSFYGSKSLSSDFEWKKPKYFYR